MEIAQRRILKDVRILQDNETELHQRHVYFHIKDSNLFKMKILFIPQTYPYTHGCFMFEIYFPVSYPMDPPLITFFPKQNSVRFHPNFYENGHVCLSVINTWSSPDWVPSMSVLSLINVITERFHERPLTLEPGRECASDSDIDMFNKYVRYGVFSHAIYNKNIPVAFSEFSKEIQTYFQAHEEAIMNELKTLADKSHTVTLHQLAYRHKMVFDYAKITASLKN